MSSSPEAAFEQALAFVAALGSFNTPRRTFVNRIFLPISHQLPVAVVGGRSPVKCVRHPAVKGCYLYNGDLPTAALRTFRERLLLGGNREQGKADFRQTFGA